MTRQILSGIIMILLSASHAAKSENVFGSAQWIGGNDEDMGLYAPYLTVFRLSWDVDSDSDSWLKFGDETVKIFVETDRERGEILLSSTEKSDTQSRSFTSDKLKEDVTHNVELAVALLGMPRINDYLGTP